MLRFLCALDKPTESRVKARMASAGLGLRWYVTERFVARTDWTLYTAFVSDQRSTEYRAIAHLPGADDAKIWEPEPTTIYTWGGNA